MTTGFAGAAARLVSQALEEEDDNTVTLFSTSSEENREAESELEDEDDLMVPKKRVYAKYRKLVWTPWSHGNDEYFYDEAQYTEALWALAKQEFGGLKENGVFFIKGTRRPGTAFQSAFEHSILSRGWGNDVVVEVANKVKKGTFLVHQTLLICRVARFQGVVVTWDRFAEGA